MGGRQHVDPPAAGLCLSGRDPGCVRAPRRGWKFARVINTDLALAALDHALMTRQPAARIMHHSDQGVQYASATYVARLESVGARVSMASVGNPYASAKAERFFRTLKHEEVSLEGDQTFAESEANLHRFIEDIYNTKRLNSALGYRPPAEFEATFVLAAARS